MNRVRGFTLIEVMVVLVILSFVVLALTPNFSTFRPPGQDIDRLRLVLEAVAERAQTRGTPMAVEFLPQGYRCSTFDLRGNWVPVTDEALFAPQDLPGQITWKTLRVDGQPSPLRLVFGSEMPSFELDIATPSGNLRLASSPTGAVRRKEESPS